MNRYRKIAISAVVTGLTAIVAGTGTYAAFSGTTSNTGNGFSAGTVAISDNDAGGALLTLTNATAGDSTNGCIEITYTGSLNAEVRIYGAVAGTLGPYLDLTVERGTQGSPSFPSCAGFSSAATVYSGTLAAFPSTWGGGIADGLTWVTNDARVYRFTVTLSNDPAAQGKSATADFTWEARNL